MPRSRLGKRKEARQRRSARKAARLNDSLFRMSEGWQECFVDLVKRYFAFGAVRLGGTTEEREGAARRRVHQHAIGRDGQTRPENQQEVRVLSRPDADKTPTTPRKTPTKERQKTLGTATLKTPRQKSFETGDHFFPARTTRSRFGKTSAAAMGQW